MLTGVWSRVFRDALLEVSFIGVWGGEVIGALAETMVDIILDMLAAVSANMLAAVINAVEFVVSIYLEWTPPFCWAACTFWVMTVADFDRLLQDWMPSCHV